MRINKYVALATGMSRRVADKVIADGRIQLNGKTAKLSDQVEAGDTVLHNDKLLEVKDTVTIMLNKPVGYVVSRDGQGSKTIYELLPPELHHLKPIGRLDKDSSGLLLLSNDGVLAQQLTHPSFQKVKVYEISLRKPLAPLHRQMISDHGVMLEDGNSKLQLERLTDHDDSTWRVTMHEGRNRQIRRTFDSLGYDVVKLHRTNFGMYNLGNLGIGRFQVC